MTAPIVVVGAAILEGDRLLAAQRSTPSQLAGGWEFPGGKVEAGETERTALIRECREELGVEVMPRRRVGGDYVLGGAGQDAVLRVWTATITAGRPTPLEDHAALRWLAPHQWYDVAWLAADRPVVDELWRMLGLGRSPQR